MAKNNRIKKTNCSKCAEPRMKSGTLCLMHHRDHMLLYRQRVRFETITHYSNGTGTCAICGTDKYLEIDHIHGGGRQERKALNLLAGWHFYQYLRKIAYPVGYRVLCRGCNAMTHYMTDVELKQHYINAYERINHA